MCPITLMPLINDLKNTHGMNKDGQCLGGVEGLFPGERLRLHSQDRFFQYTNKHGYNYYQRLEFRMGILVMLPRMYITGQSEGDPQQLIFLALLLEKFQVENYQVNQYREEINN